MFKVVEDRAAGECLDRAKKQAKKSLSLREKAALCMVAMVLMVSGGSAFATSTSYIDPSVQTAFTQYSADITTVAGYAWPVVLTILGIFVAVRIVKKFAGKI